MTFLPSNKEKVKGGSKRCYVCDLKAINKKFLGEHMDSHSEDLKKYSFSNNMGDCCKTACKLCGKLIPLHVMRSHTKKEHSIKITDYKTKFNQFFFDIVKKVFHRCGICQLPLLLDFDSLSSHLIINKATHQLSLSEYSENFLQLVNNHKSPNSTKAQAKEAKDGTQEKDATINTNYQMSQPTKSRSVLKQRENSPVYVPVFAPNPPDNPKNPNPPDNPKNVPLTQLKNKGINQEKQLSKKKASFEEELRVATKKKNKRKEDNEDTDVFDNSKSSIQRFRSLISSLSGGDSSGYPDIEALLVRQPAREEEVRQAAREYFQGWQ